MNDGSCGAGWGLSALRWRSARFFLGPAFLLAFPALAAAQERPSISFGLGLGPAAWSNAEGTAAMGQLAYERGIHQFALRGALAMRADGNGPDDSFDRSELGILYARVRNSPRGHLALGTGLAITRVLTILTPNHPSPTHPGQWESGEYRYDNRMGLPIVAEAVFRPASAFGVGLQAHANLNSKASYAGVLLLVQLGRMR
jgi:hypothetical protein